MPSLVPPIKCQGIKTKLVPAIRALVGANITGRWIEPFCGSGVVAFNLRPERALLADTNQHIIAFYQAIQSGDLTPDRVARYLEEEGDSLRRQGESHYYTVRERFNATHDPLDFLFLNRACFNGVMRFNRRGAFNTPFCRKPERFAPAYITKIANQVRAVRQILQQRDWTFAVADFRETLSQTTKNDVVYADPPYMGRHADYFNTWSEASEQALIRLLKRLPCPFVLSTWQENEFRRNPAIEAHWTEEGLHLLSIEHFYHVGSSEDLRHGMTEALITNVPLPGAYVKPEKPRQYALEIA
ncbi:MAG TPA: Dam family site-specific DNA-(adenine-N6)-methyltransferase [Chthonomonadaceae bacterium]|nr:Dam family site-specific DNA-(adenine-N6)-methyltransferase [Chthonomonadaceae bacterium]